MININLLPSELKAKRAADKKNASLISVCFIIVLIVIALGIIAQSFKETIASNLGNLTNNTEKSDTLSDNDQKLEEMALMINDRWQTLQVIGKDRVIWSQVLQDLNNSVPLDVQLENMIVNIAKSPNFIIQGNTINEREIIKFKEKLENSPFFKNVSFKSSSIQKDTADQSEKLKFTLEFDLEKANK